MQFDQKKLEKLYKDKSIDECVDLVKQFNEEMIQRGEKLIELLWYLEKTKRYQEHDGFEKLSFKVFVWEVCHISYNRYRELYYAYNWYPKESRELGPQTIQKIRGRVGVTKIPTVLKEIKAKANKIKSPMKKRELINQVIEKHAPALTENKAQTDTKIYWKSMVEKLKHENKVLWKENRALREENNAMRKQLARQKAPVSSFLKIQDEILSHAETRKDEMRQ